MTTFRIYAAAVGRPGSAIYKPRQDFGTIEAESEMRALDLVAEKIGERHLPRTRSIPVMGIGSIKVEAI